MAERLFLPRQSRIRKQAEYSACYERGPCPGRRGLPRRHPAGDSGGDRPGCFQRTAGAFGKRLHRALLPEHRDIVAVAKKHTGAADLSQDRVNAQLLPLLQRLPGLHPARNNGGRNRD